MSSTQVSTEQRQAASGAAAATVDLKLEVVTIPVSDIDRAKRFYEGLGWRLDADFSGDGWRAVLEEAVRDATVGIEAVSDRVQA